MWLALAVIGAQPCWLVLQLAVARALGAEVTAAQLGFGPSLRVGSLGGTELRLALLPFGAWARPSDAGRSFAVLVLAPWSLLGLLVVLAGARPDDFACGFTQLLRLPRVVPRLTQWNEALRLTPLGSCARLWARLVALNLLPLGPLAGGSVVASVLPKRLAPGFLLGSLVLLLAWLVLVAKASLST